MTAAQTEAARLIAKIALRTNPLERAELLETVSVLLPDSEAAAARHIAWMLRKTEEQQLTFRTLLSGDNGGPLLTPVK